MEAYCNLLQETADSHTSFSKEYRSKIRHQSSLSSYHTTKYAQIQTIDSFEQVPQLLQSRCNDIQQVIAIHKEQVERMYPSKRLGTVHQHYLSNVMEKSFKAAHAPLSKVSKKLEKLHEQEEKAQRALHNANTRYENLSLDSTVSKTKLLNAHEHQKKKRKDLNEINADISRAEKEYNEEQNIYYEKATGIYHQCRELEKERLDHIKQMLIGFLRVAHTSQYSAEYNAIFEDLITTIEIQQNSIEDLNFWARTYHVDTLTTTNDDNDVDTFPESPTTVRKTRTSRQIETENDITTVESITEQEQSLADTTTISAISNKNTSNTEQ
jgi:hypothetical protein